MKKLMAITALIVVFSLTFALFTGAFALSFGKNSLTSTQPSVTQASADDDILGTITEYFSIANQLSFVKNITSKLFGSVDPGDAAVIGTLIGKITPSLGK